MTLTHAQLHWTDAGEPRSDHFDDLYFSTDNGFAESHYVFVSHNGLPERWQAHPRRQFVIAETGFGSGLNFLASCIEFLRFRAESPESPLQQLHFISFEKYPLTRADLQRAHERWPELAELTAELQAQYPLAIAGCHRLVLQGGQITLDLWLGDIKDTLPTLAYGDEGLVDAWYLDGFAPSKNPDMWTPALFKSMALVARDQSTLSTFTAAGDVRRGLQAAGYRISKAKGFGKKREMLTGRFERPVSDDGKDYRQRQWQGNVPGWYHRPAAEGVQNITVIGGGVASASACLALCRRGLNVTLLCRDAQAALAASGNRQGGLYPLLNANRDPLSQLYSTAFGYSTRLARQLLSENFAIPSGLDGLLQLGYTPQLRERHQQLLNRGGYPAELVQGLSAVAASELAGVYIAHPCLYYPQAGWVSPVALTRSILAKAGETGRLKIEYEVEIREIAQQGTDWQLTDAEGRQRTTEALVLANGDGLTAFEQCHSLPLYPTSGQVSQINADENSLPLKKVLCYKGYLTPAHEGQHCIGASFVRTRASMALTGEEHEENIDKLRHCNDADWSRSLADNNPASSPRGKVGIRLSALDHLPMVGAVPKAEETAAVYGDLQKGKPAHAYPPAPHYPNLYMLAALGSRGLCSAPLLGEVLASQICGEPQPLPLALLNHLNPNRYWIKQLRKGKKIG